MDPRGWLFLVRVEERQTARAKKNTEISKHRSLRDFTSERRLAMRKREKSEPVPKIQLFQRNSSV